MLAILLLAGLGSRAPGRAATAAVTVDVRRDSGLATVKVRWSGAPPAAVLALNLDSAQEARFRPREVRREGSELFGVTLLRRIGTRGAATLAFDARRLASFLGDSVVLVTAHALDGLTAEILAGDPSVKGGERVARTEAIRTEDLGPRFAFVSQADDEDVASIFAPGASRPPRMGAPDRRRLIVGSGGARSSVRLALRE